MKKKIFLFYTKCTYEGYCSFGAAKKRFFLYIKFNATTPKSCFIPYSELDKSLYIDLWMDSRDLCEIKLSSIFFNRLSFCATCTEYEYNLIYYDVIVIFWPPSTNYGLVKSKILQLKDKNIR